MTAEQIVVRGYFTTDQPGFVRASSGDKNEYLRGDNTWGVITSVPSLGDNSVPLSKLAQIPASTMLGNASGTTANVAALTPPQIRALLGLPEVTWQLVAKTFDTSFATSTLASVPIGISGSPYLGWTVAALHSYYFRFVCMVQSSSLNTGIALSVLGPGAAVFGASGIMVGQASVGPTVIQAGAITGSDVPVTSTGVAVVNTDYVFYVEGVIIPSEPGTLVLRAANETGTNAVTVKAGSFGLLMDKAP